jgi:DNA mismatch repair protein MutL
MAAIRILPEVLSNKIAAGEVVERPASVVKELVENALDAGSDRILIDIEQGGKSLIQVADNGNGMRRDDALLSIERYATSKIHTDEDLFSIRTLGFRGEALPSIASVSRFTLVTRPADQDTATSIEINGGTVHHVAECGAPPGTMVRVARLFFNTPARRKFMKTVNTETGHIVDTVSRAALAWPGVTFHLDHNGRKLKRFRRAQHHDERVAAVLGPTQGEGLLAVCHKENGTHIHGWVGRPDNVRSSSRTLFFFVNNRFVRDRMILSALMQGYAGRLMKGRFPVGALFIKVPHDRVDVNVHPAKHEVRFADSHLVHNGVRTAVSLALSAPPPAAAAQRRELAESRSAYPGHHRDQRRPHCVNGAEGGKRKGDTGAAPVSKPCPAEKRASGTASDGDASPDQPAPRQTSLLAKRFFADLRVIGQFSDTYILCESESELFLVDQHAAHERIYYEALRQQRQQRSGMTSQRLLLPETIDLTYREADILHKLLREFARCGLEIEQLGSESFVITAVPVILAGKPVAPLIRDIVDSVAHSGFSRGLEKVIDECLILMACHSVIRARQQLTPAEMQKLLSQMDRCDNPAHCPHGRPTFIRYSEASIRKAFGRNG